MSVMFKLTASLFLQLLVFLQLNVIHRFNITLKVTETHKGSYNTPYCPSNLTNIINVLIIMCVAFALHKRKLRTITL